MISLKKGGEATQLAAFKKIYLQLGWKPNAKKGGDDFDVDASAIAVGKNGKLIEERNFVFYGNLSTPCGGIEHSGDNVDGQPDANGQLVDENNNPYNERITLDFERMSPKIFEIFIAITIHEAHERGQVFGMVDETNARLINATNNRQVAHYELSERLATDTSCELFRFYKQNDKWYLETLEEGYGTDLEDILARHFDGEIEN